MKMVPLGAVIRSAGKRAGDLTDLPVYSVTKHAGFVPSLEYFKKQVYGRDLAKYRLVKEGHFAYATIHLDEGSIGIAPESALISPMYTVFSIDHGRVDPEYLLRYLKSPRALAHYPKLGKGAIHRRKSISLKALGTLEVPLPPIDEQRRIAAILDHADALREKRTEQLAHLDTLAQSIFHDMFGGRSFENKLAREVMPSMRNGLSPSKSGSVVAPVLTLSAITQGPFNPIAQKVGTFQGDPPPEKRVSALDFLMCRGNGNRTLVGAGAYSTEDRPDLVFPDTMIAGRVDDSLILLPYLEMAWKQPNIRHQIESSARTTNGTHKINQQSIAKVSLPVPPTDIQREFVIRMASVNRHRRSLETTLIETNDLFASLQSRAFSGLL